VPQDALAKIPAGYDFATAAAIPLTGLTAWQCLTEELEATPGETVLIPGGSGSFGEMAVPLAKSLGVRVTVSGNARAKARFLRMGAEQYVDYRKENYWEVLSPVDHVIDTLGAGEFDHELSVLKPGGRLVSLRTGPNRVFAVRKQLPAWKRLLFSLAGAKYDGAARRQGKAYRFLFVREDGGQLQAITEIVERHHIAPRLDSRVFTLDTAGEALKLVAEGHPDGKVILQIP
jgi:NADPH:quinone reductase-like Zn-dependent oxidoreductase